MFTLAHTHTHTTVVSVGFANSCYVMIVDRANVCLTIVNDVQLLSNFSLDLRLKFGDWCYSLPPFVFQANATTGSIACSPLQKNVEQGIFKGCNNISFDTSSCQRKKIDAFFGGLNKSKACISRTTNRKFLSDL